jgi:hypothetical protein
VIFLPIFHARGQKWRPRLRWTRAFRWLGDTQEYPEGVVYRLWLGPLLLVMMVSPSPAPQEEP